jgi:hypothetical protein
MTRLSAISIFDSHCARAYVDDQGDFSYAPYGLDILGGLGKLCSQLKTCIEEEQVLNRPNLNAFSYIGKSETKGGALHPCLERSEQAR